LIQTIPEPFAIGSKPCDLALTKETEPHVHHGLCGLRVFLNPQEAGYRPTRFDRIGSVTDNVQHFSATLGSEDESVQDREPSLHLLVFTRRLTDLRHDSERNPASGVIPEHWPKRGCLPPTRADAQGLQDDSGNSRPPTASQATTRPSRFVPLIVAGSDSMLAVRVWRVSAFGRRAVNRRTR
jgi:hypothetical protein